MTVAEARARLLEAKRWYLTRLEREAMGILDPPEVAVRLEAELWAAGEALRAAETGRSEVVAPSVPPQDAVQREIEIAEQLHRTAVRAARQRTAVAVKAAQAAAQRAAARREQAAVRREAQRALLQADAAKRVGRTETAGFPTELLQRSQDVRVPYAVNFRETYADDAFYFDAIAPCGPWVRGDERDDVDVEEGTNP